MKKQDTGHGLAIASYFISVKLRQRRSGLDDLVSLIQLCSYGTEFATKVEITSSGIHNEFLKNTPCLLQNQYLNILYYIRISYLPPC